MTQDSPVDGPADWSARAAGFLACHQRLLNVELHLITTPLGLYAGLALIGGVSPVLPAIAGVGYAVSLLGRIPGRLWAATAIATATLVALAIALPVSWPWALGLMAAAWVGQEAAHHVAGETTFQSTYQGQTGWLGDLAIHTWELLPLVLLSAWRRDIPFLSRLVARERVVHTALSSDAQPDIDAIRDWVMDNLETTDHTTHWWQHELPYAVREAFERLASHPDVVGMYEQAYGPGTHVEMVHGMNEIYVTGPEKDLTSDTVFYMSHIDGPWTVFPGAAVHRCMVGISPNARVRTHFTMTGRGRHEKSWILTEGEAVTFDFNRELHYITNEPGVPAADLRINLKTHHMACPWWLAPWGRLLAWLTTMYNIRARRVFLDTIDPNSWRTRAGAAFVVATTKFFDLLQGHVGTANALYAGALAIAAGASGSLIPWVAGISFVHYLVYIATFADRTHVSYGTFLRDAVFFKTMSMGTLAALYLSYGVVDPLSLSLIAIGFGLAAWASARLGVEGTYFGVELGLLQPRRITAFPYGTIPHPMILGAVVGLLGVHTLAPFRADWPWLVPVHVALYLVHMIQEQLDTRGDDEARGDNVVDLAA